MVHFIDTTSCESKKPKEPHKMFATLASRVVYDCATNGRNLEETRRTTFPRLVTMICSEGKKRRSP